MGKKNDKKSVRNLAFLRRAPLTSEVVLFLFAVQIKEEDRLKIVVCNPLTGLVAGAGKNEDAALDEFAESFMTLVDFHYSNGTIEEFITAHIQENVHTVELTYPTPATLRVVKRERKTPQRNDRAASQSGTYHPAARNAVSNWVAIPA